MKDHALYLSFQHVSTLPQFTTYTDIFIYIWVRCVVVSVLLSCKPIFLACVFHLVLSVCGISSLGICWKLIHQRISKHTLFVLQERNTQNPNIWIWQRFYFLLWFFGFECVLLYLNAWHTLNAIQCVLKEEHTKRLLYYTLKRRRESVTMILSYRYSYFS